MKNIYTLFIALMVAVSSVTADNFFITIDGVAYSPSVISVEVGDVVTISAAPSHPLMQVSETSWNANEAMQLVGGFGTEATDYTFTITVPDDIYFVCTNHVGAGMKGRIEVSNTTGIADAASVTSLNIYPNPVTNGQFTIASSQLLDGKQLEVYNMNGQQVRTQVLNGLQVQVDLNLSNGVYEAVLVENDQAIVRKRLIFTSR